MRPALDLVHRLALSSVSLGDHEGKVNRSAGIWCSTYGGNGVAGCDEFMIVIVHQGLTIIIQ